jgi:hypothetical protein
MRDMLSRRRVLPDMLVRQAANVNREHVAALDCGFGVPLTLAKRLQGESSTVGGLRWNGAESA